MSIVVTSLALTYKKLATMWLWCMSMHLYFLQQHLSSKTCLGYLFLLTLLCVWSSIGRIFDFCNNQWFWLFKYLKVRKILVSSLQKIEMKIITLLQLFQNSPSKEVTSFMKLGQFLNGYLIIFKKNYSHGYIWKLGFDFFIIMVTNHKITLILGKGLVQFLISNNINVFN